MCWCFNLNWNVIKWIQQQPKRCNTSVSSLHLLKTVWFWSSVITSTCLQVPACSHSTVCHDVTIHYLWLRDFIYSDRELRLASKQSIFPSSVWFGISRKKRTVFIRCPLSHVLFLAWLEHLQLQTPPKQIDMWVKNVDPSRLAKKKDVFDLRRAEAEQKILSLQRTRGVLTGRSRLSCFVFHYFSSLTSSHSSASLACATKKKKTKNCMMFQHIETVWAWRVRCKGFQRGNGLKKEEH